MKCTFKGMLQAALQHKTGVNAFKVPSIILSKTAVIKRTLSFEIWYFLNVPLHTHTHTHTQTQTHKRTNAQKHKHKQTRTQIILKHFYLTTNF